MKMPTIKIDPQFKALIPPLSQDELDRLKQNLIAHDEQSPDARADASSEPYCSHDQK